MHRNIKSLSNEVILWHHHDLILKTKWKNENTNISGGVFKRNTRVTSDNRVMTNGRSVSEGGLKWASCSQRGGGYQTASLTRLTFDPRADNLAGRSGCRDMLRKHGNTQSSSHQRSFNCYNYYHDSNLFLFLSSIYIYLWNISTCIIVLIILFYCWKK